MKPQEEALAQRLADMIGRRREEIVSHWLDAVRAGQRLSGVPLTALRDALPDYLDQIRRELSTRGPVTFEESGGTAWRLVAQEHALTRVKMGFDITQLVHEFVVLRRVMFDIAVRERVFEGEPSSVLAELIEAGIAVAVESYVEARDYESRRRQAANVGFVTHELRNPLNAAMLAAERVREESSGRSGSALNALDRSLRRMLELVDSVLDTARNESDATDCHPTPTTLGELFADPLSTAEVHAQRKGLVLEAHFEASTRLDVDRDLTRSAVQNLLDNAVKYTHEGNIDVSVEERSEDIVIHVRDSCPGISPEELQTIFQPFRRGHTGTKGTGLGLTIAKRAARLQGGDLQAESEGDRGCHFWMTLPRRVRPSRPTDGED